LPIVFRVQLKWQCVLSTFLNVRKNKPTKHLYSVSIIYAHCLLATPYDRLYYVILTVAGFGAFSVEYHKWVLIHKNIKAKAQIYSR
jgi:hypothetical protein